MSKLTKEHLRKVETCSPLLPNPGPEVVEELLGHIYALEAENASIEKERYEACEKMLDLEEKVATLKAEKQFALDEWKKAAKFADEELNAGVQEPMWVAANFADTEYWIRPVPPNSDRSALEAHDAEVYRRGIEQGLATRMEAIERVKAEVRDRALEEAAKRDCEWCARGLELDGDYHKAWGDIGQPLCQAIHIRALRGSK